VRFDVGYCLFDVVFGCIVSVWFSVLNGLVLLCSMFVVRFIFVGLNDMFV